MEKQDNCPSISKALTKVKRRWKKINGTDISDVIKEIKKELNIK